MTKPATRAKAPAAPDMPPDMALAGVWHWDPHPNGTNEWRLQSADFSTKWYFKAERAIEEARRYLLSQPKDALTLLPIEQIRTNGGTQARASLDEATVAEYAATYQELSYQQNGLDRMPPIVVYYDGTDHWLADGFHRLEAYRRFLEEGKPSASPRALRAEIRQGTRRDAVLYACGANASHGLRRTNADKRRAVETLLLDDEWQKWSDSEIGRRCQVDHKTVASVRAELYPGNSQDSRTVERGGTTYQMTPATAINRPDGAPADAAPFWQAMSPKHPTAHLWARAGMNTYRSACGMTAQRAPAGSPDGGHCSSCVRATWTEKPNQAELPALPADLHLWTRWRNDDGTIGMRAVYGVKLHGTDAAAMEAEARALARPLAELSSHDWRVFDDGTGYTASHQEFDVIRAPDLPRLALAAWRARADESWLPDQPDDVIDGLYLAGYDWNGTAWVRGTHVLRDLPMNELRFLAGLSEQTPSDDSASDRNAYAAKEAADRELLSQAETAITSGNLSDARALLDRVQVLTWRRNQLRDKLILPPTSAGDLRERAGALGLILEEREGGVLLYWPGEKPELYDTQPLAVADQWLRDTAPRLLTLRADASGWQLRPHPVGGQELYACVHANGALSTAAYADMLLAYGEALRMTAARIPALDYALTGRLTALGGAYAAMSPHIEPDGQISYEVMAPKGYHDPQWVRATATEIADLVGRWEARKASETAPALEPADRRRLPPEQQALDQARHLVGLLEAGNTTGAMHVWGLLGQSIAGEQFLILPPLPRDDMGLLIEQARDAYRLLNDDGLASAASLIKLVTHKAMESEVAA